MWALRAPREARSMAHEGMGHVRCHSHCVLDSPVDDVCIGAADFAERLHIVVHIHLGLLLG